MTTTARNIRTVKVASWEDPWTASLYKVKEARYLVMEDKMTELQGLIDSLATL